MKSEVESRSPVHGPAIRYTATFASGQLERVKALASTRRHSVSQVIRELVDQALAAHEREVLTYELADLAEEAWSQWPGCDNSFAREAYHLAEKFLSANGRFVISSWPAEEHYFKSGLDFAERVMAMAITQSEAVGP